MNKISDVAKAIASGIGAAATYFIGVVPAEGGFDDLTTGQWLGVIPVTLVVYGITWYVPDSMTPARRSRKATRPPG